MSDSEKNTISLSEEFKSRRSLYINEFDTKAFKDRYRYECNQFFQTMLNCYYETFSKIAEEKKETKQKVLDFGCGVSPIFIGAAVAAGLNMEVTMSDFLPQNRKEIGKWMNQEEDALDFKDFFDYLDTISKRGSGAEELTRKSIVRIDSHDLQDDLSHDYNKYDIVVTSYCLENAATCQEEYDLFLKKVSNMATEGGHLVMGVVLGSTMYQVGETIFPHITLSEDLVKKSIAAAGLEFLDFKNQDKVENIFTDYNGIGYFLAKRPFKF